jgi:tRNA (guanine-N7-)-methyltransferase
MTRPLRTIKSYINRARKKTATAEKVFAWGLKNLVLPEDQEFNPVHFFSNPGPLTLEIGFGTGDFLASLAKNKPQENFLGIEVYQPGAVSLFKKIQAVNLSNVGIYLKDCSLVLKLFPNEILDRVFVLFPDPWPKKRHHKRRLIQVEFLHLLKQKIKPQGIIIIATDCESYAKQIEKAAGEVGFLKSHLTNELEEINRAILNTKFALRAKSRANSIRFLFYRLEEVILVG